MKRLSAYARDRLPLEEPLILAGDYNVIPAVADARNPQMWVGDALFLPRTRSEFRALINLGLTDAVRAATDEPGLYTFWDYQAGAWQKNNGIRIDHMLLSPAGRRSADRCGHRPARAHLGEAVRSRAGVARSGHRRSGTALAARRCVLSSHQNIAHLRIFILGMELFGRAAGVRKPRRLDSLGARPLSNQLDT